MHGAQKGTVAAGFPDLCAIRNHFIQRHALQHLFPEHAGCCSEIRLHSRIVIGEIRMGSMGVGYANAVAKTGNIHVQFLDFRHCRITEIYMAQPAYVAGHLIHQPTRLAVILVLGPLRHMRDLFCSSRSFIKQAVQNRPNQRFKSS